MASGHNAHGQVSARGRGSLTRLCTAVGVRFPTTAIDGSLMVVTHVRDNTAPSLGIGVVTTQESIESGERVDGHSGDGAAESTAVTTSIVLPAYNEAPNLPTLVEDLVSVAESDRMAPYRPVEIVVVDDGSTDETAQVLRDLADEVPLLRTIFLRRNFGQSSAPAAGIDDARGQWTVTMDADGQNDPEDVPMLLDTLQDGQDCVSGWRRERRDPLSKKVPSAIQTRLATLTGPDIHDFGCTLKAYRASALRDIDLFGEGHRYIPAKLHKKGYSITEREVRHHPRTEGETSYGGSRLVKGFLDLVFNTFWNRYSARPAHFLGGFGVLFMTVGLLIGGHAILLKYLFDVSLVPRLPRLILSVALVLFGFQLLMLGFLAEMISKLHYIESKPYRIETVYGGASDDTSGTDSPPTTARAAASASEQSVTDRPAGADE